MGKYAESISLEEASSIASGLSNPKKPLSSDDWEYLFNKYLKRYHKHPQSKNLDRSDWEGNYKKMIIYEKKIMDSVTLVITELKKTPDLLSFMKQRGMSDENINWNLIIQLGENAIYEFRKYLNWSEVSKRQFDMSFIPHIAEFIDWKMLSRGYVSDEIIRRYHDKLDWEAISCKGLSQTLLEEFEHKVYWDKLPPVCYPEEFIVKYYDRLKHVQYTPENDKFFKRVGLKNVNWDVIRVDNLSDKLITKKSDLINWELNRVNLSKRNWPSEFIEQYADRFIWRELPVAHTGDAKLINKYKDQINWEQLSFELKSEKFIKYFHEYVVWHNLPSKEFSNDFVIKFKSKIYWPNMKVDHLTEDTLEKCLKFLGPVWTRISRKEDLSLKFIARHHKSVDWSVIAHRKDLPDKFRKKFHKQIQPHIKDTYQVSEAVETAYDKNILDPEQQKFMGGYN